MFTLVISDNDARKYAGSLAADFSSVRVVATSPEDLRSQLPSADGLVTFGLELTDILLDSDPDACLVLIDFRRYSRHFRLLAEEAAARNIRTVILTDVDEEGGKTEEEDASDGELKAEVRAAYPRG